ncbi:MAG: ABC transporter substrate-binding protein [Ostreibacterium sp.]
MKVRMILFPVVIGAIFAASFVFAGEVQLFHDKGFWSKQLQKVGDACEKETTVKIVQMPYSSPEQYKAFIQSSISAGDSPNMFTWWTGDSFKALVSTGKIATLDDVWSTMISDGSYSSSVKKMFTVNGKAYAVPLSLARWVVLYNKPLFKKLGISEPKTWKELKSAATKIKRAGKTPFLATVQDGWRGFIWFQELMLRLHPEAYDGLYDGSVSYDSDAVRDVFQVWSKMYKKGWFSDPRSNEEVNDYVRGKGAMYLIGEWAVGLLEDAGIKEKDLGVFIMPNYTKKTKPSVIIEGAPIVISVNGKKDKDTMKALRYWVSVKGANVWGKASGNYIGNDKARAPNAIVAKVNKDISKSNASVHLRWWEAVPADIQGQLVAELNRFMLAPTMKTAQDVMAKMQAINSDYWSNN